VFRDETGLTVSPDLWGSIIRALDGSSWFVLLASPEAAQSKWVDQEVEHWLARGPEFRDRILLVLTAGTIDWDDERDTFGAATDAIPPALVTAFDDEPLYVDLSWAHGDHQLDLGNPRFGESIAHVAAPIHGVTPDDLISEDIRQHRRTVRLRRVAIASLSVLTVLAVGASVAAVRNAREANQNAAESRSRELAALAESSIVDDPQLAALLALEALYPESSRTDEAIAAHRNTLNQLLSVDSYPTGRRMQTDAQAIAISPDGTTLATLANLAEAGRLELWNIATGEPEADPIPIDLEVPANVKLPVDMAFSPDGASVLIWNVDGVEVVDVVSRSSTSIPDASSAAAWRADGSFVYADGARRTVMGRLDANSQPVELGTVDAEISALLPTVSGALVVGTPAGGAGWVLPPGGGSFAPLPVPDSATSTGGPSNVVWVADPREDAVHRYGLELYPDLDPDREGIPNYAVVRLPLESGATTPYADQHASVPVASGTLIASDDGSFMAAVDGLSEQGLSGAAGGTPNRGELVHIWHPASGGAQISIRTTDARDVAWVPNQRVLAIATRRGVEFIRVSMNPFASDVWALDVSSDGSRVVTADGGYSGSIVVRDAPFSDVVARYRGGPQLDTDWDLGPADDQLSVRPDGRVAVFSRRGYPETVDLDTGEARPAANVPDEVVLNSPRFSPDGSQLSFGFSRPAGPMRESGWMLVDAETGDVVLEVPDGGASEVRPLAWSASGASLYLSSQDPGSGSVTLSDYVVETGETTEITTTEPPSAFAASDDGATIAVGYSDGDVAAIDVGTGAVTWSLPVHLTEVTSLDFSHPDGERDEALLLSVGSSVVISEVDGGEEIWSSNEVPALADGERWTLAEFSPDGRSIPMGGGLEAFHVLVDFDPALACRSVDDDSFERVKAITESASVCLRVPGLRDSDIEARPPGAATRPPIVAVPYDVSVGVDPALPPTDVDTDGEPATDIDPRTFLPEVAIPTFDATCTAFVDNDELPLRQDQRGRTVAQVQTLLVSLGYELNVDGCFGTRTTSAVGDFQASAGLDVDGVVGPVALQAMIQATIFD
jgi:WD40 repeat protein